MSFRTDHGSRLKSLELQGYKTFAKKTTFEFAPTITAIVGPNGSGKSNIADAIRWVLGEQSYSLLRGKRTEDMIFSGSDGRARAGMAAATIKFDNGDGWLPIDFNEVTVGRRAYRDGQNEYLINGQKVLLRDVGELLSESGLAERTYTVIGQGLVDSALSLRAEERRELFEEAAGIGLYRSRRAEAVRRLENTRRNLERVQDILTELRPRLRSLERQAQRARDYEQVKSDLQEALRTWYGFHWNQLQARVADARRSAREHEHQRNVLRGRQGKIESQLKSTRREIEELRAKLQGWSDDSADLYERREGLGRRVAVLEERISWLGEQRSMMQSELDALQESRHTLTNLVETARGELQGRQSKLAEMERISLGEEGAELTTRRELEERVESLRRDLEQLAARRAARQARQEQFEERREEIQTEAGQLKAALEAAEAATLQAESGVAAARKDLEKAEADHRRLGERAESAQQEDQELLEALNEARERRNKASSEAARLEARMEAVRELLEGTHGAARLLLKAAESGRLSGLVGRLVAQLKVPKDLRTAVSAALGDLVGGIVLRSQGDLERALEYLEGRSNGGRAVLLAPPDRDPPQRLPAPDGEGVIGNAADLVRGSQETGILVGDLLSRTIVVRDRTVARRLVGSLPDDAQVVTRSGELFSPRGTVKVGAPDHGPDRAQRERLEANLARARERRREQEALVEELTVKERAAAEAAQETRERREEARDTVAGARDRLQDAELVRREAAQREAQLKERWEGLRSQLEGLDARRSPRIEDEEGLEDERRRLERELAESQRRLSGWGGEGGRGEWEARWEAAKRGVEEARDRLQEREARLRSLDQELEAWHGRLDRSESERGQKQSELDQTRAEAEAVEAEMNARREELGPTEQALREFERRRADLETAESELRSEVQAAENRHSQAQIELARREEELLGLKRRIEDDFGLVAYEYDEETTGQEPLPLEGLVEHLPNVGKLPDGLEAQVKRLRAQLRRMGSVNPEAQEEYKAVKERAEFMTSQVDDLRRAEAQIQEVIAELDVVMAREFRTTFEAVAAEFKDTFTRLFGGGGARLTLSDPDDPNQSGIEIEARLPGRREQGLAVLSGGERSLTACALIFALIKVAPTPFCVLDEVDAMLDEANVGRFCDLLQELAAQTQFVVITHNRQTVQVAQAVYGISMSVDSTSKAISLDLDEAARDVAA